MLVVEGSFDLVHDFESQVCPKSGDVISVTSQHPVNHEWHTSHWLVRRRQFEVAAKDEHRPREGLKLEHVILYVIKHTM